MGDQTSGNPELASLVAKRIQATGLSLKDLADRSGLNSSHLSLIKSGKRGISEETARKLAEALNRNPAKLEDEMEELMEAAQSRSSRMISLPIVLPRRAFSFTVPAHYFNALARLEYKIADEGLLNKEALLEFERNWRRGGTIYVYEEKDEKKGVMEMHDSDFRRLTVENIRRRKITYHFFTSDGGEARDLAAQLYWRGMDETKLHIYRPRTDVDSDKRTDPVLSDPFAKRRICIMYLEDDDTEPVVYEKVLDDPLFFDRVDPAFADRLKREFETNIGKDLRNNEESKWQKVSF